MYNLGDWLFEVILLLFVILLVGGILIGVVQLWGYEYCMSGMNQTATTCMHLKPWWMIW